MPPDKGMNVKLTEPQQAVLDYLSHATRPVGATDCRSVNVIARVLGKSREAVTAPLSALERRGLVKRHPKGAYLAESGGVYVDGFSITPAGEELGHVHR